MLVIIVVFANMTLFAINHIIVSSIVSIMLSIELHTNRFQTSGNLSVYRFTEPELWCAIVRRQGTIVKYLNFSD